MTILVSHKCLVASCTSTSHKWEWNGLTLREVLQVQEILGMDPKEFNAALGTANTGITSDGARAWITLVMLLHKRDGVVVSHDDVDVDLAALEAVDDPQPEPEPEGKGTPTPTTPSPRPGGEEGTSTSGPEPAEGSEPRSSTTPSTSGSSTG